MKSENKNAVTDNDHYIIAIGASAGGLEAIHEFFDNMPSNGNLSFVIIQHLSADYKSLLVELVAKHTNMKVVEAGHDIAVEKGHVYVIPNNKLLTIKNGRIQLSVKNFEKAPNTAIDTFLNSLAEDQGSKAIAVILSGTGTDGTRGIEAIHSGGGMVLVQDPVTSKFNGMPNSAIASGVADFILAPELMPEEIYNYIQERPLRLSSIGMADETLLPEILRLIEKHCQYDFYNYKTPTLLRRISRRMLTLGYSNVKDYIEHLRSSGEECKTLGKEFLIGVTKFFRDSAAFDILRNEVMPEIINTKESGDAIKVWVTACSTGEEAYSMAILISEALQKTGRQLEVKIFATDIDLDAIDFASKGTYPVTSVEEIDGSLVKKYFTRRGNFVTINPELRKQIVFARHNILKDPPFIKNDLVSCRNMLIYMNTILQRKVLSTLQFSLNTGGFLFMGPSETPAPVKEGFDEFNGKWKFFKKTSNDNRYSPDKFPFAQTLKPQGNNVTGRDNTTLKELSEDFRSILTDEYGFAAVYIDKNLEVKEAVGDFKKYLALPDRVSSLQILKMLDHDLALALNAAIRKAGKENTKVNLNNVKLKQGKGEKSINIFVRPSTREGYMLVVFGEGHELMLKHVPEFKPQNSAEAAAYIAELEEELKDARASLQISVESLETANEELQSSNEELLSANEELQSSNEELQSLNEELHTLNTEHQLRIKELIELNDDLNNYFRSTELGQIFVDSKLRIRKFNPSAVKMVNLIDSDIGRPIEHISTNLKNSQLQTDINTVLATNSTIEKEVMLNNDTILLMRILPYLRQDRTVDGVVITFFDITRFKELSNIISAVFNASLSAIMAFRAVKEHGEVVDFRWIAANHESDRLLGKAQEHYLGRSLKKEFPALASHDIFQKAVEVVKTGKPMRMELQLPEENGAIWYELAATRMEEGLVISLTNINSKKIAEEQFRQNYDELASTKENYHKLNIELEEKVAERTRELSESEERFRLAANAASDVIWDWDLISNRMWWSETFYTRFGFNREAVESSSHFWMEQIHDEDRQAVDESIRKAIASGSDWSARYRLRKADGSYATIHDRGMVLADTEGRRHRMIGAMMDITESERSALQLHLQNEALQKLFQEFKFVTDFMPQMVWSTSAEGFHDFYNKGWYDYTGLSYEETKGEGWNQVVHPEDRERAWKVFQHSLETGDPYEIEYRFKRYDGSYRWFLGRALPFRDEEGRIVKWFGTCTDIHDQKIMNDILEAKVEERTQELQKANADLEASNNELLQFASVASHDLKEPLRKIHMFSNLLKERYFTQVDGASDYLNRITAASARMTKLINDLLTLTRLSVSSNFQNTSLNLIVDEVMSDLELSINETGAMIEVQELPSVEIIQGQMRQVIQNLISNSLKFTAKGVRPRISITAELITSCNVDAPASPTGKWCKLVFRDNGIGFDNQYAEKIFTIFQRLHSREKYEGTGIGLAITKKIIDKHNGIIRAHSNENEGATFVIILPLKQAAPVELQMSSN